ncbi:hypothetical protein [Salidesulfovibrio onnuriiensis]|uniref:hypothetical protein n=1 Tax=Salidesulfovibrio onnuriiensis TaxID=2583823 RepID=UPI0011CC4CA9|nr:hypothetical protein [Salidesulfovibrio onnuriiensis]
MKKLMLTLVMVLLLSSIAAAQETFTPQGSLVVPGVSANYVSNTNRTITKFLLTNVSGNAVQVKVTVYDRNGNDVSKYCNVYEGSSNKNSWSLVAQGTGTFDLAAHGTRVVNFGYNITNANVIGHAVIEWASSDKLQRKALMGSLRFFSAYNTGDHSYGQQFLNSGQAF